MIYSLCQYYTITLFLTIHAKVVPDYKKTRHFKRIRVKTFIYFYYIVIE